MKLCIFSCLRVHVLTICSQERDDRGSLNRNGIYWSGSIADSRVTTSHSEETGNNINCLQRLERVNTPCSSRSCQGCAAALRHNPGKANS